MSINSNNSNKQNNVSHNNPLNPLPNNSTNNSQTFNKNYQIIISNYTKAVKYYSTHKQIADEIEKMVSEYKDIMKEFLKKLKQLHDNIKAFEEKTFSKNEVNIYSKIKMYLSYIKHICQYQKDSLRDLLTDFDNKNIFMLNNRKDDTFLNSLHQNKNNLQNEGKKLEKEFIDYDNKYSKLMNNFEDTEDIFKNFFYNKRKNSIEGKKTDNSEEFDNAIKETLNAEEEFGKVYSNFKNNNNKFFDKYAKYINDLEEKINKDYNYLNNNIDLFISSILNNHTNINKVYEKVLNIYKEREKSKKENERNDSIDNGNKINDKEEEKYKDENNFNLFKMKYLEEYESKYIREKYKIKSIHQHSFTININNKNNNKNNNNTNNNSKDNNSVSYSPKIKSIKNSKNTKNRFSQNDSEKIETAYLLDEDIYEIVKSFYGPFQFIDKSEYNLETEKRKICIKNLTNKLLLFGFSKKKNNEYSDLKPITEEEVNKLLNCLEKKEYRILFLHKLNNFRTLGIFEIPQKEFDIFSKYFKSMIETISNDKEKDFDSIKLILILSQTFYVNDNDKKHYLDWEIKGHKIFSDKDFWEKYIKININNEIEKIIKNKNKMNGKAYVDSAFSNIVPFCANMMDFGMTKDTLLEIIEPICKGFDLDEKSKATIQEVIESQTNFIKD